MINKLIAVFLALSIALSCLFVPSFASPFDIPDDFSRFVTDVWNLTESLDKGEISNSDFFQKISSSMVRFGINYAGDVSCFKDVLKVIEFCGIDVPDKWKEWFYENKMGGGGSGGNRDDTLLNGYGAVCQHYSNGELSDTLYCAYGIIHKQWGNQIVGYSKDDVTCRRVFVNGRIFTDSPAVMGYLGQDDINTYVFYGDWRYDNGDKANDNITELPEKVPPTFDDDSVSDDDIIDFLKDLLEKLQMQFPDLSTIEGLLRAILAKCEEIEQRIGEGGKGLTAEELQPMLDQLILAITMADKQNTKDVLKSNDELLKELIKIRKILQGFDDDEELDDDTANSILEGLISGLTSGLLSMINIDVDVTELITICKEGGKLGLKLLTGIVDIVAFLSSAVPFNVIRTCLVSVFGVIFSEVQPSDLTFTLDGNSYTFLSASFLQLPIVAGVLNIIKGFISILIIFTWLKWARKFYINML